MDEHALLQEATQHLAASGVEDDLVAVGWFYPRGHTGALFAGGFGGSSTGELFGDAAGGLAEAAGSIAGAHAVDAASGLPKRTFVAVSASKVYLMGTAQDGGMVPGQVFGVLDRGRLEVKVHQRVNVRVLELVDTDSGSAVELEGSRVPTTHAGDVITALRG